MQDRTIGCFDSIKADTQPHFDSRIPSWQTRTMTEETPLAPMTAEDVVKRIAAECAYVDADGAVGIRLKAAAALVRQYADQFRSASSVRAPRRPPAARPAAQTALLLPVAGARAKSRGPGG
jgi:hypothetical protein